MSLKDKAVVIFKPSRYKSGTVYGFRGGDWSFSRNSAGSRYDENDYVSDVAANVPKLDYNLVGDCPQVRLEGSTTNSCPYSEDFYGQWAKQNIGIHPNVAIAPDGTMTASRMYNNAGTSVQFLLFKQTAITVVSGRQYILSAFVKPDKYFKVCLHLGGSSQVTFDLRNGASANVIEYPNGWYRVWTAITAGASSNQYMYLSFDDVGYRTESTAESKSLFIWGAQIQEYLLSDYIPTTSSAVTSANDNVTNSSADFVKGTDEYTIYFDLYKRNQNIVATVAQLLGEGSIYNGSIHQYTYNFYYTNSSGSSYALGGLDTNVNYNKIAIRHNGNGLFDIFRNGIKYASYDHSSVFASAQNYDTIQLNGSRYVYNGSFGYNEGGLIEYVLFKGTVSDAECRYLTSYKDYDELAGRLELTYNHRTKVEANIERIKNL